MVENDTLERTQKFVLVKFVPVIYKYAVPEYNI